MAIAPAPTSTRPIAKLAHEVTLHLPFPRYARSGTPSPPPVNEAPPVRSRPLNIGSDKNARVRGFSPVDHCTRLRRHELSERLAYRSSPGAQAQEPSMSFTLPELPYAYDALAP